MQVVPATAAAPSRQAETGEGDVGDFMAMLASLLAAPAEAGAESGAETSGGEQPPEEVPLEEPAEESDADPVLADAAPDAEPKLMPIPPLVAGAIEPHAARTITEPTLRSRVDVRDARPEAVAAPAVEPQPEIEPEAETPPAEPAATEAADSTEPAVVDRRPVRRPPERTEGEARSTRNPAPAHPVTGAASGLEAAATITQSGPAVDAQPLQEVPAPQAIEAELDTPQQRPGPQAPEPQLRENPAQPQPLEQRPRDRAPVDAATRNLATRQIETIRQAVRGFAMQATGEYELRVALSPPNLGALKLRIKVEEGNVSGVIITDNHAARHLLQQHLPEIREALAQQGMQLGDFKFQGEAREDAPRQPQRGSTAKPEAIETTRPDFEAAQVRDGRVMGYL